MFVVVWLVLSEPTDNNARRGVRLRRPLCIQCSSFTIQFLPVSIRTERVAATVRKALGDYLSRERPDHLEGMVTITSVKLSPDLAVGKVYVSLMGGKTSPEILVKRMNDHQGEYRSVLAKVLRLRKVPELRFFKDDTLEEAEQIEELIKRVREEDDRIAAARGETPGADRAAEFDPPEHNRLDDDVDDSHEDQSE